MKPDNRVKFIKVLAVLTGIGVFVAIALIGFENYARKTFVTDRLMTEVKPPMPTPQGMLVSEKDGMQMMFVPAGKFLMGSTQAQADAAFQDCQRKYTTLKCSQAVFNAQVPQHTVYLDAYWIDRTEVTNAQYQKCVAGGTCTPPQEKKSYKRNDYYGDARYSDYPVIYVSWYQAKSYCEWAGRRLPSEAEWEKAARGVDGRTYPWGSEINCNRANYYYAGKDGSKNYCVGDTIMVGSYPDWSSPSGAVDMAGNVWEWVNDYYNEGYYQHSPPSNPPGPQEGQDRIYRGGSWTDEAEGLSSVLRMRSNPNNWIFNLGFRCASSK
jgi:formylglycine-generating enzyme required for sulfatase activity